MSRLLTIEEFIKRAQNVHGTEHYDYSESEYKGVNSKIKIYCNVCKEYFYQNVRHHIDRGHGCPKCGAKLFTEKYKLTTEEFIRRAKEVHGDKYDYSETVYTGIFEKVKIHCNRCNKDFYQMTKTHLDGRGCKECNIKERGKKCRLTTKYFIKKSKEVHGDLFDYSETNYDEKFISGKVKIFCKECKEYFYQDPNSHMYGKGCPKCNTLKARLACRTTTEKFIEKAKLVHGNDFDYTETEILNDTKKVKIKCNKCKKTFMQDFSNHLQGTGCPYCRSSKGEIKISKILDYCNVKYEIQKTFAGCKNKKPLPFDFYLPDYNMCIEYQGEQHYGIESSVHWFSHFTESEKEEYFENLKRRDKIKKDFCKNNNIKLLEISYKDDVKQGLINALNLNVDFSNFKHNKFINILPRTKGIKK